MELRFQLHFEVNLLCRKNYMMHIECDVDWSTELGGAFGKTEKSLACAEKQTRISIQITLP
jgi:hypothetical protein